MGAQDSTPSTSEDNGSTNGRVVGRPFRKGQSGNPGGRPKGIATEARRLAGTDGRKLLKLLSGIALDEGEKTADRIRAAEIVLERGFGKAPAFALIEGENPLELTELGNEIEATLDDLAEKRAARAAGGSEAPPLAGAGEAGAG